MSRTYGSKYDFNKNYNKNDDYKDLSEIYTSGDINADIKTSRHPNKKKKTNSLSREFTENGISGTRYYRYRFGEEDYKSSRCRLVKREQTQERRQRMKEQTKQIIEESLEDYEQNI